MSTRFLLIRHAQSIWNASGRWQGHADPPLSADGVAQAEALAGTLAEESADVLLCSDLERARHTAAIVGASIGLEPRPDPGLRELDVGRWEGLTRAEIAAREAEALTRFDAGEPWAKAGGGESREALRERVLATFTAIVERHRGARLVVVTHLGVIGALVSGVEVPNAGTVRTDDEALFATRTDAALESANESG